MKDFLKRAWHFIWHDDSLASWLVNLVLAFILVKFVIYPGLGLLFGTSFPIVAVVSSSMEHEQPSFTEWWERNHAFYETYDIQKEDFITFPFKNGFNKGDIMFLKGIEPKDIKVGNVLVYEHSNSINPIIHRVVQIDEAHNRYFTKGDNNKRQDDGYVTPEAISRTGKAIFRVPYLGWIKIGFVQIIGRG